MKLPAPVQTYFDADRDDDADRLMNAFAIDARVEDEGATHIGQADIAVWWRAAKDRYQPVTTPVDAETIGSLTIVKASVSGSFPGSPALLTFKFEVAGNRIAHLEIGA